MFGDIISKAISGVVGSGLSGMLGGDSGGDSRANIRIPSFGIREMPMTVKTPAGKTGKVEQVTQQWNTLYSSWLSILDMYDKLPKGPSVGSKSLSSMIRKLK